MNYILSVTRPPEEGAAFGKATIFEPVAIPEQAGLRIVTILAPLKAGNAATFAEAVCHELTGTECVHTETGLTFRIDTEGQAPNACPCCGRLVNWQDHALAGSDDAYCDGCYVWGDSSRISCNPHHSAHHNPWSTDPGGARWYLEVVIDRGGETDHDYRYASDKELLHDDPGDAARIAWPGLAPEQIISATLTGISG